MRQFIFEFVFSSFFQRYPEKYDFEKIAKIRKTNWFGFDEMIYFTFFHQIGEKLDPKSENKDVFGITSS